jgi:hypothetical protein
MVLVQAMPSRFVDSSSRRIESIWNTRTNSTILQNILQHFTIIINYLANHIWNSDEIGIQFDRQARQKC